MEQCFSGYCRALDASRVVMADTDDGAADCDFPACLHAPVCKIAAELREFWAKWWKSLRNRREKSEFSPDFRKNSGKTCKKD